MIDTDGADSDDEVSDDEQGSNKRRRIEAEDVDELKFETVLGVWWPKHIYESKDYFNQKIPRRKLEVNDAGEKGVLIAKSAWPVVPDGCAVVYKTRKHQLRDSKTLYD